MSTPLSPGHPLAAHIHLHPPARVACLPGGLGCGWPAGWVGCTGLDALRPLAPRWRPGCGWRRCFSGGADQLRDWGTTLDLFAYEYQVPLLPRRWPPCWAPGPRCCCRCCWCWAWAGGWPRWPVGSQRGGRAQPPDMPDAAFQLHVFWGSLLAALAIYGPGRWSWTAGCTGAGADGVRGRCAGWCG